jgi:hypothetical protein
MRGPAILALAGLLALLPSACPQEQASRPSLRRSTGPDQAQSPPEPSEDSSNVCVQTTPRDGSELPHVQIVEVRFQHEQALGPAAQAAIASELKNHDYQGAGWWYDACERARDAWMQRGYFRAMPHMSYQELSGDAQRQQVRITLDGVDEGTRYRLGGLGFKNSHAFPTTQLRALFRIRRGEVFDIARIRDGLQAVRELYGRSGYIDFTSVPDTTIDQREVSLVIDVDEGKQFNVESVTIRGAPAELEAEIRTWWTSRIGRPLDPAETEAFYLSYAARMPIRPRGIEEAAEIHRNEAEGKVQLTFTFGLGDEVFTCGP